jgi:hypothetical protein
MAETKSEFVDPVAERIVTPPTAAEEINEQYLTARAGVSLRTEATTPKGRAERWRDVTEAFESYLWREWHAKETWVDEKGVRPTSHRFGLTYTNDVFGRILGAHRAARKLWSDELTTAMVVRRARAFGENGQPQPPADHLDDLLSSNGNVYAAYRRELREKRGLQFARYSVLEPHRNGYTHQHDALLINGDVGAAALRPALDAHVRNVPQARPEFHGEDAIVAETDPETWSYPADPEGAPPVSALPREMCKSLGAFLGTSPDDDSEDTDGEAKMVPPVLRADAGPRRFAALLWARGVRQFRPGRRLFPHLVAASQSEFGSATEPPSDVDPNPDPPAVVGGGVERVDTDPREITFERSNAPAELSEGVAT